MKAPPKEADLIVAYFDSMKKVIRGWGATIDAPAWRAMKADCEQLVIDAARHERAKLCVYLTQIESGQRPYSCCPRMTIDDIRNGEHWVKLKDT